MRAELHFSEGALPDGLSEHVMANALGLFVLLGLLFLRLLLLLRLGCCDHILSVERLRQIIGLSSSATQGGAALAAEAVVYFVGGGVDEAGVAEGVLLILLVLLLFHIFFNISLD